MNIERLKDNALEWYVMRCRKAADITTELDAYNNNPDIAEQDRIDNYFVPAKTIERKNVTRTLPETRLTARERLRTANALRSNSIRNTLRSFVFLLVRPSGLAALSAQRWNQLDRRIYHYRDYDGEEVTVSQRMMERFIDACLEFGNKLEICTVQQKISNGIKVTVREGAFAGLEAEVTDLQYKAEGIRFTIVVRLFANGNYAYVHDRKPEDVIVSDQESYVFNSDFIDRIEDSLLTILKRRVKHRETTEDKALSDEQVRQYYRLHNVSIGDADLSVRFEALMSVCATLLRNKAAKTKYNKTLKRRIKDVTQGETAYRSPYRCHAYLLSALFLSTKDPAYRAELKHLVQSHLPTDPFLHRHLIILRLL